MDDKNKLLPLPHFNNEDEERKFWATHDSTEYIDWDKAEINPLFLRLKKSPQMVPDREPD